MVVGFASFVGFTGFLGFAGFLGGCIGLRSGGLTRVCRVQGTLCPDPGLGAEV